VFGHSVIAGRVKKPLSTLMANVVESDIAFLSPTTTTASLLSVVASLESRASTQIHDVDGVDVIAGL
jgi:hypothetical protein